MDVWVANPSACNYDEDALIDDGSCDFTSCIVVGCNDPMACNYDENAEYDDGSCTYILEGACDCDGNVEDVLGECGGSCASDNNDNGVCDDAEILGCTSEFACNYGQLRPSTTGLAFISCLAFGCTDPMACDYVRLPNLTTARHLPAFPYDCDGICVNAQMGMTSATNSKCLAVWTPPHQLQRRGHGRRWQLRLPDLYFDCNGV